MNDEASPRPWRTKRSPIGSNTWIVSGETFVASASRIADAALIVDAVNHMDYDLSIRTELNDASAECDRLRYLVKRLAEFVNDTVCITPSDKEGAQSLLREARAAIGEDNP